eukprot:1957504-Amphidinium_carterae.1
MLSYMHGQRTQVGGCAQGIGQLFAALVSRTHAPLEREVLEQSAGKLNSNFPFQLPPLDGDCKSAAYDGTCFERSSEVRKCLCSMAVKLVMHIWTSSKPLE